MPHYVDGFVVPVPADRKRINALAMKDPRLAEMMDPKAMPFDGPRMVFGGFKTFLDL